MLKIVLVLGALAVALAVAWRALRRERGPEQPYTGDCDAYMRNIRSTTCDFGSKPHPPDDPEAWKAPILGPSRASE